MPAPSPRVSKTYSAVSGPGASTAAVVPQNPLRIGLFIQNTSVSAGAVRFGGPVQGSGSDILVAAGAAHRWDQSDTCPQESVHVQSAANATWCIIEVVTTK